MKDIEDFTSWDFFKYGFLIIICILVLTWLIQGNQFFLYKVFAPATEQVRREVFEQSKAYNQGMVQELQNMRFEYVKANDEQKAALRSIILHRSADFDREKMPADLRAFIDKLGTQRWKEAS